MGKTIIESYGTSESILYLVLVSFLVFVFLIYLFKKDNKPNLDKNIGIIINKKVFYNAIYWNIDSKESFEQDEKVEVIEIIKCKAKIKKLSIKDENN